MTSTTTTTRKSSFVMPVHTDRYIGRCSSCKKVHTSTRACSWIECSCFKGQRVKMSEIIGSPSAKECGARCINAVGPSCDCSCRGENHGSNH